MKTETQTSGNPGGKDRAELKTRGKTGAFLTLIGIFVLAFSHIPYVLNTAAAVLSVLGIRELLSAAKANTRGRMLVLSLAAVLICFLKIPHYPLILSTLWVIAVLVFLLLMLRPGTARFSSFAATAPCALMLPLFFRSFAEIRQGSRGLFVLILVILGCMLNEVAAYFVGKSIGKRKLAPAISPGKTLEGGLGGLVISTLLSLLLAVLYARLAKAELRFGWLLLYLILASLAGQFGDLSMSVIKRSAGIKDFGKILPGHGGILDRFDSLLFTAPFALLYISMTGGFFV